MGTKYKICIPYLKKEIQDLQALITSDEQIRQIANMMKTLNMIEQQLEESKTS